MDEKNIDKSYHNNLTPIDENGEIDFKALIRQEELKYNESNINKSNVNESFDEDRNIIDDTKEVYKKSDINKYREEYLFFHPDEELSSEIDKNEKYYDEDEEKLSNNEKVIYKNFIGDFFKFFSGFVLATFLIFYVLPNVNFFRHSPLYRSLDKVAEKTAFDVANSINKIVDKSSPELTGKKTLTVPEIVQQYRSAVVTVTTKVYSENPKDKAKTYIGTGFILDSKGNIATNFHVIDKADEINVIFQDGTEHKAKVINSDELTDLSILNIVDNIEMPGVVTFGDSEDIDVGEGVVAIGNPLNRNFAGTVTFGIISAKEREVDIAGTKIKYIQTDAAINEGNSGGPLFNMNGEVIGINTAKLKRSNIEGIGFSIPINVLKNKLAFLSTPPVQVGLTAKDLTEDELRRLNINNGIIIIEIKDGLPADKQGLRIGDVITRIDGVAIRTTTQMNEIKSKKKAGESIKLTIFRSNKTFEVNLVLVQSQ